MTINHSVSVAGVYKAKVVNPNGVSDPRPTGDEEEVNVNFGYSNAYWATPISITVSGNNTVSWYLKQNSTNGVVSFWIWRGRQTILLIFLLMNVILC